MKCLSKGSRYASIPCKPIRNKTKPAPGPEPPTLGLSWRSTACNLRLRGASACCWPSRQGLQSVWPGTRSCHHVYGGRHHVYGGRHAACSWTDLLARRAKPLKHAGSDLPASLHGGCPSACAFSRAKQEVRQHGIVAKGATGPVRGVGPCEASFAAVTWTEQHAPAVFCNGSTGHAGQSRTRGNC